MAVSCPKTSLSVYRPRRPEKTVLFEVIKKYYKTWHKKQENAVPFYVDKVFKQYLQCGILAHGFACAHCHGCHQDFLIAFSCKGRGICPSCNTRMMAVQLEPLDFLDRIAAFIPPPRRHRHHYHGVFAPNAPQRPLIAATASQAQKNFVLPNVQETSDKITKVTLSWARLIARIYEVNPLL